MAAAVPYAIMAGAAVSAMGAMSAAKAQTQAANYNAQLAERNASVVREQTSAQIELQRRQADQVHGSLIAKVGAAGVTMDGSPMDVLQNSIANAVLDEHTIKYKGEMQARGYQESAALDRFQGKTATRQGYYHAASSLLTGAGNSYYASQLASRGTVVAPGNPQR